MSSEKIIIWVKQHKRELKLLGITAGALILIILGIKNRELLQAFWETLIKRMPNPEAITSTVTKVTKESVKTTNEVLRTSSEVREVIPYKVRGHVRTLPKNWRPSPEKIATAPIELLPGQTWVRDYTKGVSAA